LTFNDAIPQGETGKPADELAYKMLDAINHQEFTETKEFIGHLEELTGMSGNYNKI